MKIVFWVEQCMHILFECSEDVNEITKTHTKAVFVNFCLTSEISLSFQVISVHLSLPLFNFTPWKEKCESYMFITKKLTQYVPGFFGS